MTDWSTTSPAAFTVQRVGADGDFVHGGPRKNALRYRTKAVQTNTASDKIATKSSLTAVTSSHDAIELSWAWPTEYADWTEVAIVRSGFGHPSTVNDGVTVYRDTKEEYEYFNAAGEPYTIVIEDTGLQAGRWYYYTVFFHTASWQPAMYSEALVPRDFGHQAHLVAGIPEYYRWVDARFRGDEGYLRQFLKTFAFELDMTREYVESWQDVYHTDFCPQPLLTQLGYNLGVAPDQGLGEIRTRALIGQINELYDMRGTVAGLRSIVETTSKYDTTITRGRNLMLLPDDAEFLTGTGGWVLSEAFLPLNIPYWSSLANSSLPQAQATGTAFDAIVRSSDNPYGWIGWTDVAGDVNGELKQYPSAHAKAFDARVSATPTPRNVVLSVIDTSDKATAAGKGVMQIITGTDYGAGDVTLTCGLGETVDQRALTPQYHGIPVEEGMTYGFSCSFKIILASGVTTTSTGTAGIYWYDRNELFLGSTQSGVALDGSWQELLAGGVAPDNAIYAIPYVNVSGRVSGDDYRMMGAMFYATGEGGTVTAFAPDRYLTLGAAGEYLGNEDTVPANNDPKVMGG